MHRSLWVCLLTGALLGVSSPAYAGSVLFSGSGAGEEGVSLSASALFTINGSTLTIKLKNTGDSSGTKQDVPGNLLTGVFFDLPTGVSLVTVSAAVAPGAILQPQECDPGKCNGSTTNVGGEFGYKTSTSNWSGYHSGNHGIAASGYVGTPSGNMGGGDLDGPANPNGPNFGITPDVTASNPFKPNGGLTGVPLIEEEVLFTLTLKKNHQPFGGLLLADISNVSFQYGTSFGQPKLPGGMKPPPNVPEPGTLLLLASGLAVVARQRKRRQR
jgi:hypothetical protein